MGFLRIFFFHSLVSDSRESLLLVFFPAAPVFLPLPQGTWKDGWAIHAVLFADWMRALGICGWSVVWWARKNWGKHSSRMFLCTLSSDDYRTEKCKDTWKCLCEVTTDRTRPTLGGQGTTMGIMASASKTSLASVHLSLPEPDAFSLKFALCFCGAQICPLHFATARHSRIEQLAHGRSSAFPSVSPHSCLFLWPHTFSLTKMRESSHTLTWKINSTSLSSNL